MLRLTAEVRARGGGLEALTAAFAEEPGLSPAVLGHVFEQGLATDHRQADGVFYTPGWVTRFLVRETLGPLLAGGSSEPLRILDPSCGGGAFLVPALAALADAGRPGAVFGVDLDPDALAVARLALAHQPGVARPVDFHLRRGNAVVADAAVDPVALAWGSAPWSEPFDAVVGNPPYVRQELLTPYKGHWRQSFDAFHGKADLFVYFFERSLQRLRAGGRLGFIVSNKWLRGDYAGPLRRLLAERTTVERIVDFGHAPVFPDAEVHPVVVVLRKTPAPAAHGVSVTRIPRDVLDPDGLAERIDAEAFPVPQARLSAPAWTLQPPRVEALLARLRTAGPALGSLPGLRPLYGIKTGFNEAFLFDRSAFEALVAEDPSVRPLFRPYLRGRDMARWRPRWAERWMLWLASSSDVAWPWANAATVEQAERILAEAHPGLFRHLKSHEARLRARRGQGRFWWELIACRYRDALQAPKIGVHRYQYQSKFGLIDGDLLINDALAFIPSDDPWVLAVLNSGVFWFLAWHTFPRKLNETVAMDQVRVREAPIPEPTDAQREAVAAAVAVLVSGMADGAARLAAERACEDAVQAAFGLTAADRAVMAGSGVQRWPPGINVVGAGVSTCAPTE